MASVLGHALLGSVAWHAFACLDQWLVVGHALDAVCVREEVCVCE